MKPLMRLLLAAILVPPLPAAPRAVGAERIPIEDFARTPELSHLQLSPDGQSVAFLSEFGGQRHLCVSELDEPGVRRFQIGRGNWSGVMMPKEVTSFRWISDRRLVLTTSIWDSSYGVAAVDRDGSNWRGLSGYEEDPSGRDPVFAFDTLHAFHDPDERILMLDRRDWLGTVRFYPHVREVNTLTGAGRTVLENPGNVVSWSVDHEGVVRLGIVRDDETSAVIYRENESEDWRTLPLPRRGHEKLRALGFDPHNGRFYVAGFNAEDRWTILPYDLADGSLGEPLLSDPEYDVVPEGFMPSIGGVPLARVVFSEARQELVGVWYLRDAPRVKWLNPEFSAFQAAMDKALPRTVNILVGQSRDDQQLLVFSFSDRDPGAYLLFDRGKRSFKGIGARMPWIKPETMAQMYAIKYEVRDEYKFARKKWIELIGDPDEDEAFLTSISPVNFAAGMTAPLLIVQGKEDRTVPPQQARAMIAALKKARREVESVFLAGEGHTLANEKTRLLAFQSIVEFLEKHLGPARPVQSSR